ncbi:endonuclease/exonuclease/phosphatase family protein [Spirillospora sp. NPDC047279]|uniref:endonuclease/exonuclease/phosphatase family protein n=1 Tax=Spirillospora sp. NPDC047279 TaxID=3155478 RepID=UPI003408F60A
MRRVRDSVSVVLLTAMVTMLGLFIGPGQAASSHPVSLRVVRDVAGRPPVALITTRDARRPPSRRDAASVPIPVQHYNLCAGNATCVEQPALKQRAMDLVARVKAAEGTWFISLNEVCRKDVQELVRLTRGDAVMVASWAGGPRCEGDWYGNAVIHPGGVLEGYTAEYFPTQEARPCGGVECRTYVCLRLGTAAGPMSVCSAHLENNAPIARKQAEEYLWLATGYAAGRPKVLAGDFNLRPDQLDGPEAAPAYFAGMRDLVAPYSPTYQTWSDDDGDPETPPVRATPRNHIDYIWVDRTGESIAYPASCDDAAPASDHCHTMGVWLR